MVGRGSGAVGDGRVDVVVLRRRNLRSCVGRGRGVRLAVVGSGERRLCRGFGVGVGKEGGLMSGIEAGESVVRSQGKTLKEGRLVGLFLTHKPCLYSTPSPQSTPSPPTLPPLSLQYTCSLHDECRRRYPCCRAQAEHPRGGAPRLGCLHGLVSCVLCVCVECACVTWVERHVAKRFERRSASLPRQLHFEI